METKYVLDSVISIHLPLVEYLKFLKNNKQPIQKIVR